MDLSIIDKIKANNKELIDLHLSFCQNTTGRFRRRKKGVVSKQEHFDRIRKINSMSSENLGFIKNSIVIINKPIYVFYHCFLENRWEIIFKRQLEKILKSGLYDSCSKIFIGACGSSVEINKLKEIISKYDKFEIFNESQDNTHEYAPLIKMKDFCDINDCYCLYLHLKGVTRDSGATWSWAEYMEYFCIEKWEKCIFALNMGYDCAGTDWSFIEFKSYGYAGNFFFANSDYIKRLMKLNISEDRYACELWIGLSNPNAFSFKYSLTNLYYEPYTRDKYEF